MSLPLHPWGNVSLTHYTEGWMDPTAGLNIMKKENLLPVPAIEPQSLGNLARILVAIPTERFYYQ
jgi:hypothetical protein